MDADPRQDPAPAADPSEGIWTRVGRPGGSGPHHHGAAAAEEEPPGVVVVDTSYVIFAKYYSTLSWYRMYLDASPDISLLMTSPVFRNRYATAFTAGIARICKGSGVPLNRVLFAKDCSKDNVWRRKIMPSYKGSRAHNASFNREVFHFTYSKVIPEWIEGHGGCCIGVDGAEADDVMGVAHRALRDHPALCGKIVIISNDNDCIQLSDPGTHITNLVMTDVGKRRGNLTPSQYLKSRILAGDRSDNIPGILPRCGMKTATRLVASGASDDIEQEHRAAWGVNDLLMNLRNTPEELTLPILESVRAEFRLPTDHSESDSSP